MLANHVACFQVCGIGFAVPVVKCNWTVPSIMILHGTGQNTNISFQTMTSTALDTWFSGFVAIRSFCWISRFNHLFALTAHESAKA
jgi:hypothetical protein